VKKTSLTGTSLVALFVFVLCALIGFWGCAIETGSDPDDTIPLAGPSSVQVTAADKALVLQWTKVAPAQGIVPVYEVYYSANSDSSKADKYGTVQSNDSNLVRTSIDGLTNGDIYYVWVKAVFVGLGASKLSPTTSGIPIPPPPTPGTLTITPGEEMIQINWDPVENAFTYEVYYRENAGGDAPPSDADMKTVSEAGAVVFGLTNGHSYTVWLKAVNTAGNSPAYSSGSGTPAAATSAPTTAPAIEKITVTPGDNKLALTWDQVVGVPRYTLYYGITNEFASAAALPETVPANAPTVSADITSLANDTKYYVWVQSWNSQSARDTSPKSGPVEGTPKAKDPIDFGNVKFELGKAAAEYIFAQDLPPSVFFPEGRPYTDRLTRVQETALGNLFTDGIAWYIRKNYPDENIDFVFLNGSYIDNVLPAGTVTVGGLMAIIQPDSRNRDKLYLLTLTGVQLKQFFDDVAAVVHTGRGGPHETGFFGMVSKEVNYTIQYPTAPDLPTTLPDGDSEAYYHGFIKPGTLKINGQDIVDTAVYRVCTTDYVLSGEFYTNLYTIHHDNPEADSRNLDIFPWRGVAAYIYDQGKITPYLDKRIIIEGGIPLPPPWIPGNLAKP
jgi:hypothetical protein